MAQKPQDWFIGVIDLFVILLPGSLLTFAVLRIGRSYPQSPVLTQTSWDGWEAVAAFLVASYVAGHLVSLVGSKLEDILTEIVKWAWSKQKKDRKPEQFWRTMDKTELHGLVAAGLERHGYPKDKIKSVRRLAVKSVRLSNDTALATIDRKDADRRFFRNLSVVLLVPAVGMLVRQSWVEGAAWALALLLALLRLWDQNQKFSREVFEYFVLLNPVKKKPLSDGFFRANVGAMVIDDADRVLAFRRADVSSAAWQLPQGGIDEGESPDKAVFRELAEETGLRQVDVELLGVCSEWLAYELPEGYRSQKTGRGQVQKWFLFRLRSVKDRVTIDSVEFDESSWLTREELLERTVAFRKPVYERLFKCFEGFFRPS